MKDRDPYASLLKKTINPHFYNWSDALLNRHYDLFVT